MIRRRLIIVTLAVIGLASAALNTAIACFAAVLRNRASSTLLTSHNEFADNTFADLMKHVLMYAVMVTVASVLIAIFGIMLGARLAWLRDHDRPWIYYACCHALLSVVTLTIGSWLLLNVRGFKPFFERFGGNGNVPYYYVMVYGGIGLAAYGALVIFTGFVRLVAILFLACS
ncbi:hypothetical protein N7523_005669 [Penicillium sp. IBT 18751x]|nr:hypothetical protein N7523_005669 [Penicillium sp. IBT 18751x]